LSVRSDITLKSIKKRVEKEITVLKKEHGALPHPPLNIRHMKDEERKPYFFVEIYWVVKEK